MLPYWHFDGPYCEETDAKYLSIGIAQWRNNENPNPLSAKVWRYSDSDKWSRLSEELPLHRVVDLCILTVTALFMENPVFDPKTFENQTETIELKMLQTFPSELNETKGLLKSRLIELQKVIQKAGIAA
jgi:hypothetical protein